MLRKSIRVKISRVSCLIKTLFTGIADTAVNNVYIKHEIQVHLYAHQGDTIKPLEKFYLALFLKYSLGSKNFHGNLFLIFYVSNIIFLPRILNISVKYLDQFPEIIVVENFSLKFDRSFLKWKHLKMLPFYVCVHYVCCYVCIGKLEGLRLLSCCLKLLGEQC